MKELDAHWFLRKRLEGLPLSDANKARLITAGRFFVDNVSSRFQGIITPDEIDKFRKRNRIVMSRPTFTTELAVSTIGRSLDEAAAKALNQADVQLFILFYDIHYGFAGALSEIPLAEQEIGGTYEESAAEMVSDATEELGMSMGTGAELFLQLKAERAKAARSLIEDPSGFLLMDSLVDTARRALQTGNAGSHLLGVPAFSIIGVEAARDFYKAIYPLTAPTPS